MSEEENKQVPSVSGAEHVEVQNNSSVSTEEGSVEQEEKMVPLKALQSEKRKRQDYENQLNWFKEQAMQQQRAQHLPQEDDAEELLTKGELRKLSNVQQQQIKREILEESFLQNNPEAIDRINEELPEILEKRPFLARAIEGSPNRYAAAWQLLQDYTQNKKPAGSTTNMIQKIKENEGKPGSPVGHSRSGQLGKVEAMDKMNSNEFREYRKSVRGKR